MFTVLDHTADLHIRIESPTLEELFVEAARVMVAQMYPTSLTEKMVRPAASGLTVEGSAREGDAPRGETQSTPVPSDDSWVCREIVVPALDRLFEISRGTPEEGGDAPPVRLPPVWEDLFHDWLGKVLVVCTADRVLPLDYQISFEPKGLRAMIFGRSIDPQRDVGEIEIKAVTYHNLKIERTPTGYLAEVIFDI